LCWVENGHTFQPWQGIREDGYCVVKISTICQQRRDETFVDMA
jgi:hypothetical protein